MRIMTILLVLVGACVARGGAQETARTKAEDKPGRSADALTKAAELRTRVRTMRKAVLGGGPAVEKAEKEALSFYRRKLQHHAARVLELRTSRDAQDAEYRVALDATLKAEDETTRDRAARRAAALRGKIAAIDEEIAELKRQQASLGNAIAAIEARMKRRRRIVQHLDDAGAAGADEGLVPAYLGGDAFGPDSDPGAGGDPLADEKLLEDLLRRDPERARGILFKRDPARYWQRFPLTPPVEALRKALAFPMPDLPGRR